MVAHGLTEEPECGVGGALQLSTCPGLQIPFWEMEGG